MVETLSDSSDQWVSSGDAKKVGFPQVVDYFQKENSRELDPDKQAFFDSLWEQFFWTEGLWEAINMIPGLSTIASLALWLLEKQGLKLNNISWKVDNNEKNEVDQEIQKIKDKYKTEIENNKDNKDKLKEIYGKMYKELLQYLMDNYKDNKTDFEEIMDMKIEQARELKKLDDSGTAEDWEPDDSEKQKIIDDTFNELGSNLGKNSKEYTKLQLEKIKYECGDDVENINKKISEKLKDNENYKNLQMMFKEDWTVENINNIINIDPQKMSNFIEALAESGITELFLEKAKEDSNSDIKITADLINGTTELYIQLCTKTLEKLKEMQNTGEKNIDKKQILTGVLNEIKNDIDKNNKYDQKTKDFLKQWYTIPEDQKEIDYFSPISMGAVAQKSENGKKSDDKVDDDIVDDEVPLD